MKAPAPGVNGGPRHARPAYSARPIDRSQLETVFDRLNVEPWAYDFFALVRRVEAVQHDTPGFGASNRVGEDPVRFAQEPSLAFPPSTVSQFHFPKTNAPARLFVTFMGLLGPMGPLPLHLTEFAYQRIQHHKDRTLARFLDVFNHRAISLFYRAWAASQMPASFDRAAPVSDACEMSDLERQQLLAADRDRYAAYVGSTFGMGTEDVRHRDALPDAAKLHFAGRLAAATKGPEGLASVMRTYFGVDAEVEEFAGRWVELPEADRCRLGERGPGCSLGTLSGGGAVCGARVWECQGAFRVRLGPMSFDEYQRLLPLGLPDYREEVWRRRFGGKGRAPGATSAHRVEAWIRNYLGDEFAWEVTLVLRASEIPRATLGGGTRVGWTSWIMSGSSPEDRGDLSLRSRF